jgi:hypothetical protein
MRYFSSRLASSARSTTSSASESKRRFLRGPSRPTLSMPSKTSEAYSRCSLRKGKVTLSDEQSRMSLAGSLKISFVDLVGVGLDGSGGMLAPRACVAGQVAAGAASAASR